MSTIVKLDKQIIMHKMQELCSLLLQDEGYKEMRDMIDQFAADEQATAQYERFMEKHQALEEKERQNIELLASEIQVYEEEERALYDHPLIRRFIYAQREFSQLHQQISHYFTKSVELNRLPEPKELHKEACGCGGNCSGGH
ncbi:YlbF family regulator [Paenibacillus sp. JNUCC31]|uniref:YlbF family regulator n=1 Tax=Paenibacillus sp. JNUCC-31 TaxID=2777983 RepID=UPI001781E66E|nr:YlbF family regulator [Paenibacillus sp. JNUCC-31]QOS79781.1 YlbF family regulator [Paenibacillus sp. JNUCC-31]